MKTKLQIVGFLAVAALAAVFAQGPLTPPGAPAPVMKTLDQVEPRIPLATGSPGVNTADANYHFVISQSGSYYLTANLPVTKTHGIHVTAAGVTLDLNGFRIHRGQGSGGDGVNIDAASHDCTVKNGSIAGFANGIICVGGTTRSGSFLQLSVSGCSIGLYAGNGWQLDGCKVHENNDGILGGVGSTLTNCTASFNTEDGFLCGDGCTLANCTAHSNAHYGLSCGSGCKLTNCTASLNQSYGFTCSSGCTLASCTASFNQVRGIATLSMCTLTNCTAYSNSNGDGFNIADGCTLSHCTAGLNRSSDTTSSGISAGAGCTLTACTSYFNTNSNATPSGSTGIGISCKAGSTVKDCTVKDNKGHGIQVTGNCLVLNNTTTNNGNGSTGTNGDGIVTTGTENRIEGNNTSFNNGYGIRSSSTNADVIIRNTSLNNQGFVIAGRTANYSPSTGTYFGPLSTPNTATSPWANF